MAVIIRTDSNKVIEGMGNLELLCFADENVKLCSCWGKTVWQFPKTLNTVTK